MSEDEFWKKRRLKIYSRDEYGNEEKFIVDLPIFFHNRAYARLEKVELIDQEENSIQSIEETKKKVDTHNAFQQIVTLHELKKEHEV